MRDEKRVWTHGKKRLPKRQTLKERRAVYMMPLEGADVLITVTKTGPWIKKDAIERMSGGGIVFSMANPVPEILPEEAKAGGARIVATGRSDYPNQINNVLGFPGVFRGALDVRAKSINKEMMLAAAYAIAKIAEEKGLDDR